MLCCYLLEFVLLLSHFLELSLLEIILLLLEQFLLHCVLLVIQVIHAEIIEATVKSEIVKLLSRHVLHLLSPSEYLAIVGSR